MFTIFAPARQPRACPPAQLGQWEVLNMREGVAALVYRRCVRPVETMTLGLFTSAKPGSGVLMSSASAPAMRPSTLASSTTGWWLNTCTLSVCVRRT